MTALRLVSPPEVEPVTEAEVWAHLRIPLLGSPPEPIDAAHIAVLTAAATAHLDGRDGILGRCLVTQTWELLLDQFPYGSGPIRIPLPPLQAIVSLKYIDANNDLQTLAVDQYAVDASGEPGWVAPGVDGWPATYDTLNAVVIRFRAGYPDDAASPPDYRANIPAAIKAAMLLMIGDMYANREGQIIGTIVADNQTVDRLLTPYRIFS